MKKIIFLLLTVSVITFLTSEVFAVPANPNPVEVTQPDGTKVTYYIKGDERVHWLQSPEGYTLLYDKDKFVVYAEKDPTGNLVPSKQVYRNESLRSSATDNFLLGIPKDLRYSKEQVETFTQIWKMTESEISKSPVKGDRKALCVLMGFKDKPFSKTIEDFENLMNQVGYSAGNATGSVKDFYRENSYGQMDLTVTVVGPYTAEENISYYAPENRWQPFAEEVARTADADIDYRDFATDGILETFHIIFAGYGDESLNNGRQIWAHKSQLLHPITLDDVQISVYSCSPELRGSAGTTITSIGVICHELCHVFGADDYYDIDYNIGGGNYPATGYWDLMASGSWSGPNNDGSSPAHINMFQKILYGWVEPVELDDTPQIITGMPNSTENPVAYVIKPYTNNEMYVLENRQKIGFNAYAPGNGLLIYHIHNSAAQGSIDNRKHPQQAYVVCASSTTAIPNTYVNSYGLVDSAGAVFTNVSGRDKFSGVSFPRMFRWNGNNGVAVTNKPITNITQADQLVSFEFRMEILPVNNLTASLTNNNIQLSWGEPDNHLQTGYKIFRNGELLGETTEPVFSDLDLPSGMYNYCVSAVYSNGDSEQKCVSKEVDYTPDDRYPPVKDLTLSSENNNVRLVWNVSDTGETPLSYSVLRDGVLIETTENRFYTDLLLADGHYNYCIVANYAADITSQPACTDIYLVENGISVWPLAHLKAEIVENQIQLTWDAPANSNERDYKYAIYLDNEIQEENLEDTSFTYQPERGAFYPFSVVVSSNDTVLNPVNVAITYIKILTQPANASVCEGEEHTLSVTAEPENLAYQWYFNTTPVIGAINREYTIPVVDNQNSGSYYVVVKDTLRTNRVQSANAEIGIKQRPAVEFLVLELPEKFYTDSVYTVSVKTTSNENPENATYKWSFSNDLAAFSTEETAVNSNSLIVGSQEGTGTLSVEVSLDCWIFPLRREIELVKATGIRPVPATEITLYPNPVSDVLNITSSSDLTSIRITDLNGRTLLTRSNRPLGNSQSISTEHWAKGIYLVKITDKNGSTIRRFIKN
ncbi:MAG: M6 family metalloprotease domain-containing protein [Candidatus Symbiothrix sp.]|jgi:M6 family metalloprotease-like protein|nr:M6 family metalloprotease domain-containing protein [Candidatus Symbiothrix sp.]